MRLPGHGTISVYVTWRRALSRARSQQNRTHLPLEGKKKRKEKKKIRRRVEYKQRMMYRNRDSQTRWQQRRTRKRERKRGRKRGSSSLSRSAQWGQPGDEQTADQERERVASKGDVG